MKRLSFGLAAIAVTASAVPAMAVSGGEIGTLEQGRYTCELPGDATGPVGRHVGEADFTVISASSYRTAGRLGSYLLTGDRLVMTSGPQRGQKFHRVSRGFLRQVTADGSDGEMRCVLGAGRAVPTTPCPATSDGSDPLVDPRRSEAANGREQASCASDKTLG